MFIFSAEPVYISQGQLHGVVPGRQKLIYDRRSGSLEICDLSTDPREQRNLGDSRRDRLKEMLGTLRRVSGIVVE